LGEGLEALLVEDEMVPLHAMGTSAQAIDNAGDKIAPWRKRVRKTKKTRGLDVKSQKQQEAGREGRRHKGWNQEVGTG
jgi:hypothetical protein